ncbi:MAG: L-aspartate oxidase [Hyphomicrobiaceae bacterium]
MSGEAGSVVVVGAGLAGLFTALKLSPMPVTIVTPAPIGSGASSTWAQGGIAAAVGEGDSPEAHARDTMAAGAGLVDPNVAQITAEEAAERIRDLLAYGVPFDRDLEGRLAVGREAAHSARRIVHVKGDRAGQAIMAALVRAARDTPSIRIVENVVATALLKTDGRVSGVRVRRASSRPGAETLDIMARAVVLTTGGLGQLFAVTTNPREARGEGLAMAARAGAVIADAEFVQFHPTAILAGLDPAPLATEALRGEGAVLVDARGRRFMSDLHPEAELAPRDIVARAVHHQNQLGLGAFLDCRAAIGARFPSAFPTVYERCLEGGIDPVRQPIPVAPAAHYHMGGVLTDVRGRTTLDGLWAAGEVAATGLHGANRLASNSLLEAVVFATRIAEDIAGIGPWRGLGGDPVPDSPAHAAGAPSDLASVGELRRMMTADVGVVRSGEGLAAALAGLAGMVRDGERDEIFDAMIVAATFIAAAAWKRTESRGGHFRSDHPESEGAKAVRSFLKLADAERIRAEAVEIHHGGRVAHLTARRAARGSRA